MKSSTSCRDSATRHGSAWRNATLRSVESKRPPQDFDRDEPVKIPLDPETALSGLLQVEHDSDPVESDDSDSKSQDE